MFGKYEIRRFKLNKEKKIDEKKELELETIFNSTSDMISKFFKKIAPAAFSKMVEFQEIASSCRIGSGPDRPFSSVTCVSDYCAHLHKDIRNMEGGCVVILTLKNSEKSDEQFHILPNYSIRSDKESGGIGLKLNHGSLLFEVAKNEEHCTSALVSPNRKNPSRLGLVFIQHRDLNEPFHGRMEKKKCEEILSLKNDFLRNTSTGEGHFETDPGSPLPDRSPQAPSPPHPYKCNLCPHSFSELEEVRKHFKTVHE